MWVYSNYNSYREWEAPPLELPARRVPESTRRLDGHATAVGIGSRYFISTPRYPLPHPTTPPTGRFKSRITPFRFVPFSPGLSHLLPFSAMGRSASGSGSESAAPSARASLCAAPHAEEERCVSCAAPARAPETNTLKCADRSTDTAFRRPLASRVGCKPGTLARIRSCACSRAVSSTFCFLGDCSGEDSVPLLGPACSPTGRLLRRAGGSDCSGVLPPAASVAVASPGVVCFVCLRPVSSVSNAGAL